jgi:uncharacterized protein (TIGR02147 family)
MEPISIYAFSSYRAYIRARAEEKPSTWGRLTSLAKAAGCHRPYLTKVLNQDAHLTPSQLYGLASHWKFSESETEYLLRMLEIEKASKSEFRAYLSAKNEALKRREEALSQVVARKPMGDSPKDTLYYSSWMWAAVHMLTSIPAFQTVRAISTRLSLSVPQTEFLLHSLESWGSVKQDKGKWIYAGNGHQIPKESPLVTFHHQNWRGLAVANSQLADPQSVHFTVVQSVSAEDYEKIRRLVLDAIKKSASIAGPSREEKLFCFNCDFFEPLAPLA